MAVALIGTDRIDEAVALFDEDFDADGGPQELAVNAAVRVALTLQAAGEYEHSAALLSRASAVADSPWERRELLLLTAQAESDAGHHERAARLYIESAAVPGDGPADIWSRSANLQAARALARAGLDEDAVGVLKAIQSDSPRADERVFVEHALRPF